jgi:hypothetical protein
MDFCGVLLAERKHLDGVSGSDNPAFGIDYDERAYAALDLAVVQPCGDDERVGEVLR